MRASRNSKDEERFVFGIGDYIQYRKMHFGRIDHIMLFDCMGIHRHVFIVLSKLFRSGHRDPVLDLEVMEQKDQRVIVGIPAIEPVKHYMVPVEDVGTVWVEWDVYYI